MVVSIREFLKEALQLPDFQDSQIAPHTEISAAQHILDKGNILPFLGVAFVYLVSFSTVDYILPDFWLFGADSAAQCWAQPKTHHCNWELARHPIPVLLGPLVYHIGVFVFSWLPHPYATNCAGEFPNALIGGWNACLAIALFRTVGFSGWRPYLLGLTYAAATSIWVIASFPETWIWSTLATNLFLLAFLRDPKSPSVLRLAILNAIAAFCLPPLLVIGILPVFQWFSYEPVLSAIRNTCRYSLVLLLVFFVPWLMLLFVDYEQGVSTYFVRGALNDTVDTVSGDLLALGAIIYCVFAFVPAWLPLGYYIHLRGLPFEAFLNAPALLGAVPWVAYIVGSFVVGRARRPFCGAAPIIIFLILFAGFMTIRLPDELFLYTSPFVLPFWMLVHAGYRRKEKDRRWHLAAISLCATTVLLNAAFVAGLRDAECFDPAWGVPRNCRSDWNWNPRPYREPGVSEEQRRSKLYLEW